MRVPERKAALKRTEQAHTDNVSLTFVTTFVGHSGVHRIGAEFAFPALPYP